MKDQMKPSSVPTSPRIRFKEFGGAWETRPLGELFSIRNESNESGEVREILSVLKDVGVIPYSEKGRIGNRAKDDVTKYRIARKGDIVLNSMNVIIGSVGYSAYDGCISPVYYALTPNENADSPFWGRWFWRNEAKAACTKRAAEEVGAIYVDASPLGDDPANKAIGLFEHRGVAGHPGDLGMRRLADLFLNAFSVATTETP